MSKSAPTHVVQEAPMRSYFGSAKGIINSFRESKNKTFGLLWLSAIFIPALTFAIIAYSTWQTADTEARLRISRLVDMLHEHALRSLETQEAMIEAIDQRIAGENWSTITSQSVQRFLAGLVNHSSPSGGMVIVGPDNVLRVGNFGVPETKIDLSDRDYVKAPRNNKTIYIGNILVTRPSNNAVFSLSRQIKVENSDNALIVASIKKTYFEDFYETLLITPNDVASLTREDGFPLARAPAIQDITRYLRPYTAPIINAAIPTGSAVLFAPSRNDGKKRLYVIRKVGNYPIYVTYGHDAAYITQGWLKDIISYASLCLLASLLMMIFTARTQKMVSRERAIIQAAQAETERRAAAESRLLHIQRVDALGQIVGGVAHDFRNVVASVSVAVRLINRKADDPEEVRHIAGLLEKTAERATRLTNRMLNFARRDASGTEQINIADIITNISELLDHTLGAGYRLIIKTPDAPLFVMGDSSELETALVNLVLNARDAMPDGGIITVSAEAVPLAQDEVRVGEIPLEPGDYVRLQVTDTGIGMDAKTLSKVGEAFFTTKPAGKGTGLGLASASGIAVQAGGGLQIASEVGEGTTVTMWLAQHDNDTEASA